MASKFEGTGVALVTPFTHDYSIDYTSLEKILKHVDRHVDYLVVCGTTGEATTLSNVEKIELLEYISKNSSHPILFGYGGNNTQSLVDGFEDFPWELVSGILSVSPYYNKPSQEGIIEHYQILAEASPVPIVLYNVPGRTGSKITSETVILLSQNENIVGVKEATGDLQQALEIDSNTSNDFLLISGDDMLTLPLISFGAKGVISVLANAFPQFFHNIFEYTTSNNWIKAKNEAEKILILNDLMYKEGSPSGLKQLMSYMDLCSNIVRRPLVEVSDNLAGDIFENLQKIKGIKSN